MPLQEIPPQNFREAQNRTGQTRFLQCSTLPFSIVKAQNPISTLDNRSTKTIEGVAEQPQDAQNVMNGKFRLLSTTFEHADDWGRDPNGEYWPTAKSCRMIDVKHSTDGKDIKPSWNYSKCHICKFGLVWCFGKQAGIDFTQKCLHSFWIGTKPFENILYITGYNISSLLPLGFL